MLVPMLRLTTALADRLHTPSEVEEARGVREGRRLDRGGAQRRPSESGFSTAELLGNAALGVGALVAIWLVLEQLGVDVVDYIRSQIF